MNETKRQVLPPGLWVVATPIGNLDDFTPRARQALASADWILCEDTRRTAHLFSALGAALDPSRLARFDAHSDQKAAERWIQAMSEGQSIALVTDAGTPSVSDPGSVLVSAAHEAGIRVTPIPGVSALATFLSIAGMRGTAFFFGGFFPRKSAEQDQILRKAISSPLAKIFIWFESPHRILDSLVQIEKFCAENHRNAQVSVAKELTKIHEKIFRGTPGDVRQRVAAEIEAEGPLGEWCFGLEIADDQSESFNESESGESESGWKPALRCLIQEGVSPSRAVKRVSQTFGVPKNLVYDYSLQLIDKK